MNGYIRIVTPFLYPDGDIIDVFCQERGNTIILTDLGETQRWLKMQTATQRKSSKTADLLDGICLNHGIEYSQDALLTQIRPSEDFATALIRLSQGILRVSNTRKIPFVIELVSQSLTMLMIYCESNPLRLSDFDLSLENH